VLHVVAAVVIGHSVQGRPLRAYEVGDRKSGEKILVVGCIHGDERAGIPVVTRLERAHPSFDLWLVPDLNPDSRVRTNANGVDLNRDFAMRTQPETRALVALVRRVRPTITIFYHHQNLVRAWGRSRAVARRFARLAGMRYRSLVWPPGAATRWQNRVLHETSFVVELPAGRLAPSAVTRLARAVLRLAS
jgi:murein peptide amidase A